MAVRWPLPPEHRYGRVKGAPNVHDGTQSLSDSMWLRLWQAKVKHQFPEEHLTATGIMDGPTQRIALSLQNEAGLPETGMIDEDTWNLAWQ